MVIVGSSSAAGRSCIFWEALLIQKTLTAFEDFWMTHVECCSFYNKREINNLCFILILLLCGSVAVS
jgi:hypothetical protein